MNQNIDPMIANSNPHVMIVDDVPANLDILNKILIEKDYRVQAFTKSKMALEAAILNPPDVFLLDALMPGMDGYQLCRELKKHKQTAHIPVIFLSALFNVEDKIRAFEAGGVDFITKPFHADEIFARIRTHLTLYYAEKKLQEMNELLEQEVKQKESEIKTHISNYQSILENLYGAIVGYDSGGKINFVNSSLQELLNLSKEQLIDKLIFSFLLTKDNQDIASWDDFQKHCSKQEREFRIKDSKEPLYVEFRLVPIYDANQVLVSYLAGVLNISQRIIYQENLIKAKENAERASKLRRFFLANINHELRNPINGALGMLNLLTPEQPIEEFREYHSLALRSMHQLKELVSDILDFSSIDLGKVTLRPQVFNLSEMIHTTIKTYQPMAEKKGLILKSEGPCDLFINGDPTRINQILTNLISNSIKFSINGDVVIEYKVDDELILKVSDQGNGISPRQLEEIYEPFHQLENPYQKEHSGLGLGLTIVKELVAMMEGKINVVSDKDKGSSFIITLPVQQDVKKDHSKPDSEESTDIDLSQFTILIAEDEVINRLYLKQILTKSGARVIEASNGKQAVEKTEIERPDLVFMDISMPIMNGIDAITYLRNQAEFSDLPIYALTAHTHEEDQNSFMNAGATGVVTKPFYEHSVLAIISKHKQ